MSSQVVLVQWFPQLPLVPTGVGVLSPGHGEGADMRPCAMGRTGGTSASGRANKVWGCHLSLAHPNTVCHNTGKKLYGFKLLILKALDGQCVLPVFLKGLVHGVCLEWDFL